MYRIEEIIRVESTSDYEELLYKIYDVCENLNDYHFCNKIDYFKAPGNTEPNIAYLQICTRI